MKEHNVSMMMYETIDGEQFSNKIIAERHESKLIKVIRSTVYLVEFGYKLADDEFKNKFLVVSDNDLGPDLILDQYQAPRLLNIMINQGTDYEVVRNTRKFVVASDDLFTVPDESLNSLNLEYKHKLISDAMKAYEIKKENVIFVDKDLKPYNYEFDFI